MVIFTFHSAQGKVRRQAGIWRWTFIHSQWKIHHGLTDWHLTDIMTCLTLDQTDWHLTVMINGQDWKCHLPIWVCDFSEENLLRYYNFSVSLLIVIVSQDCHKSNQRKLNWHKSSFQGERGLEGSLPWGHHPGTKAPKKVGNETRCFDRHKTATMYDHPGSVIIGS